MNYDTLKKALYNNVREELSKINKKSMFQKTGEFATIITFSGTSIILLIALFRIILKN